MAEDAQGGGASFLNAMASYLPGGSAIDPISALIAGGLDKRGGDFSQRAYRALGEMERRRAAQEEQHPVLTKVGKGAGFVLGAAPSIAGIAGLAARASGAAGPAGLGLSRAAALRAGAAGTKAPLTFGQGAMYGEGQAGTTAVGRILEKALERRQALEAAGKMAPRPVWPGWAGGQTAAENIGAEMPPTVNLRLPR